MYPTDKEKQLLQQARSYIEQRQYQQAREILVALPQNETAQKWLVKLDQIAPPSRTTASFPPAQSSPARQTATVKPTKPPLNPQMHLGIYTARLMILVSMFSVFFSIFYARNWKRLGKSEWVAETFLIGLLLTIGFVAAIAMALTHFLVGLPMVAALAAMGAGNVIYVGLLERLQTGAFKSWQRQPTDATLLNHKYDLGSAFLMWIGATAALAVGISVVYIVFATPVTYEDNLVRVVYPRTWDKDSNDWASFCQEADSQCFLTLHSGSMSVIFSKPSVRQGRSPSDQIAVYLDSTKTDPDNNVTSVTSRTVSGLPATVVDYTFKNTTDGYTYYQIGVYIPTSSQILQISIWTVHEDDYKRRHDDMIEFVDSIEVKPS